MSGQKKQDGNNVQKNDLKQYWFVIRQMASREIKRGNASKRLGQMWNILMPFVSMMILAILFTFVFEKNFREFMPFVYTGTIVYALYNSGMGSCLHALSGNKNLLVRTKIPPNVFVVEKIYVAIIHLLFSLVGYVVILIISGTLVGPTVALAPIGIIFSVFVIMGIGKILAVINVYFADINYFYKVIMRLMFYGSGIFFEVERVSPAMAAVMEYNPIYLAVHFERQCILYNQIPDPMVWVRLGLYAIGLYIIGTLIFMKGSQDVVAKV